MLIGCPKIIMDQRLEAQRADLEAAIRRLEQSLAEARQDLLDFDGETYCR